MQLKRIVMIAALLGLATPAAAQQVERIRGTLENSENGTISVKTREGPTVNITVAPDQKINTVKKIDLSAIQPGSFIGTATMGKADGSFVAMEVLVFPESARGTGEGKYPWDLTPESTMINATVATVDEGAKNTRELSVQQKGETSRVVVPDGIPVVTIEPADSKALIKGAPVFIVAKKAADGQMSAVRILVGKDGVAPPM